MDTIKGLSPLYDGPEYKKRMATDYKIPQVTLKQIHEAIPKRLYEKSTLKGLSVVARDMAFAIVFFYAATYIDPFVETLAPQGEWTQFAAKWTLWATYWWWQGLAWGGLWVLGHEAGHNVLAAHSWVNHVVGFTLHTFLFVPYYAWRASHHLHHKSTGSIERDENFVPATRSELKLPTADKITKNELAEMFEETPIFTLVRIIFMQAVGMQAYFAYNALGNRELYPGYTNHYSPYSPLFKKEEFWHIIISDIGLGVMTALTWAAVYATSLPTVVKYYTIPYLLANHWIVMLTYLHHTDPTMPHFRKDTWTFVRGAITTIDRPLLGWIGRFFLHNVSHDHVAHHLISSIPHWNGQEATAALRKVLGDDYNYDSSNTFRALYRSFSECLFIEDTGDVVFYHGKKGVPHRKQVGEEFPPAPQ
ncbi:hypothetical protein DL93DRAFT_2163444 [Clavulina sp. PMI_390]|nr:hypothetical protein DL93DRAFT_2163444 [Clavulina sp. PMI_390]